MSSKKQLRREQREKSVGETARGRLNPAQLFMLSIVAVVLLVVVAAVFMRGEAAEGPWPGAVWSEEHGHWH